jgi:hypothetical protein
VKIETQQTTNFKLRMAKLILPAEHKLSLDLAREAAALNDSLPHGVLSCCVVEPGMVELILHAGAKQGYGARSWPFRAGGVGLGDEIAMFGGPPRDPLAARFTVPIAMQGVDSAGFVDSTFWAGLKPITLVRVAERAVQWLEGGHLLVSDNDDEELLDRRSTWLDTQTHTFQKISTVLEYKSLLRDATSTGDVMDGLLLHEWLSEPLRALLGRGDNKISEADWRGLVQEVSPGIFTFDLFTHAFCDLLVHEVDCYESTKLPRRRPNTMNTLGLVVNEIGLEPLMSELLRQVIAPIAAALYPDEPHCGSLDHHHSFVVEYRLPTKSAVTFAGFDHGGVSGGGDTGLDMHHDASEATLNVCLGREGFEGAGLRFCGRFGSSDHRHTQLVATHTKGRAILHLGRHRHGADDLTSGERMNLIVWAKSSLFRAAAAYGHVPLDGYPKAVEEVWGPDGDGGGRGPDKLCLSSANDRDYEEQFKRVTLFKHRAADGAALEVDGAAKRKVDDVL